ncbi:DUF899 family protein [Mesorhizobium sp. AaZ16]|uniref:DUF899 family protein n=1 Tax=Mesorhizobium sp. AaZ16 TaxID=3402289 RepID=UPI00374F4E25
MNIAFPGESAAYRAARDRLLAKEIELRRAMQAVSVLRRELPPGGLIPEDYVFDGLSPNGAPAKLKLSELFAPGKDSLVVYNFMFPPLSQGRSARPGRGATARLKLKEGPCPSCVAFLDALDGAAKHVEGAGFNFVVIARAPLDRLTTFAKERGWRNLRLLSAAGNSFKRDYLAETPEGFQMPMVTVFHREGSEIRHFWSSEMLYAPADPGQDPRHAGTIEPSWNIFDLTREGRPSDWQEQLEYD